MVEAADADDLVVDRHEQLVRCARPEDVDHASHRVGRLGRDALGAHRAREVLGPRLAEQHGTASALEERHERRGVEVGDRGQQRRVREPVNHRAALLLRAS
jgi:hypothetical protein